MSEDKKLLQIFLDKEDYIKLRTYLIKEDKKIREFFTEIIKNLPNNEQA
jgi:hypothetical protein